MPSALLRVLLVLTLALSLAGCAEGSAGRPMMSIPDASVSPDSAIPDASVMDAQGMDAMSMPCSAMDCSALSGPCGAGVCDETTNTCIVEPVANGTMCSDENACTMGDMCMDGSCVGGEAIDCSAMDGVCSVGTCDPATGSCGSMPAADDTLCDDSNACTEMDRCTGGSCNGTPRDCSLLTDMCNTGACDETTGMCAATPVADGTMCDDGSADTTDDQCRGGVCRGSGDCRWLLISQGTQFDNMTLQNLLTTNGFDITVRTNNGGSGTYSADATFLGGYTHLIFHHTNRAITSAENTTLTNWLNAGGRMIATGYDTMGSPTDTSFATLMGCSSPGDGPFTTSLTVADATHPIMMGPYQTFAASASLSATSTDHDRCTPTTDATRLVSMTSGSTTSSKLQIRTGVGAGMGISVYWNGNGSLSGDVTDWTTSSATPTDLQNLLLNTMQHLCNAP